MTVTEQEMIARYQRLKRERRRYALAVIAAGVILTVVGALLASHDHERNAGLMEWTGVVVLLIGVWRAR